MADISIRVIRKDSLPLECGVKRGRISDQNLKSCLKACFYKYVGADLESVVDGFCNNRGSKSYFGSLEPQKFYDQQRRKIGFWMGTADCFVVATELLDENTAKTVSKLLRQTLEAQNAN